MVLQERVGIINDFVVNQRYRVEIPNKVHPTYELSKKEQGIIDSYALDSDGFFIMPHLAIHQTFGNRKRLVYRILNLGGEWFAQGRSFTDEELVKYLDTLKVYEVAEVKVW